MPFITLGFLRLVALRRVERGCFRIETSPMERRVVWRVVDGRLERMRAS